MRRASAAVLPAVLLVALAAGPARAERVFASREPQVRVGDERVESWTKAGWTWTTVTLDLENPADEDLRATLTRFVPPGAVVTAMTLTAGEERLVATIHERQQARATYDALTDAVKNRSDPALLERVTASKLRLQVAPVPPGREVTVSYTYVVSGDRAPEIARSIREMTEAIRERNGLDEVTFDRVVDAHGYQVIDPRVRAVVERSREQGVLSVFTSLLAVPPADSPAAEDRPGLAGSRGELEAMLVRLAAVQAPDGSWNREGSDRGGDAEITGLVIFAFLSAGETHKTGRYRDTVKSGLRFLKRLQAEDGAFAPRKHSRFALIHARASLGMTQAYAMTGSPLFKESAALAFSAIVAAQNADGGWGIRPGYRSRTSVTLEMLEALLIVCDAGGIDIEEEPIRRGFAWLDGVTDPETGLVSELPGSGEPEGPKRLAVGGLCLRLQIGENPRDDARVRAALATLRARPPRVTGDADPREWAFGARVCWHGRFDREHRIGWWSALREAIRDRGHFGIVRTFGAVNRELGRVGSTALAAAALAPLTCWSGYPMVPRRRFSRR